MYLNKKEKKKKEEQTEEKKKEKQTKEKTITPEELIASLQSSPEQRSIMLVGEIDEEKSADLISALLVLSQQKAKGKDRADDIKIYVSTYGGSADEMFSIYDVMDYCKQFCDIETIGLGKVMSAGTLILASGTKGKRKLGKHCRVMIHSVNGGSIGELHSLQNEMEQMKVLQDNYIQCLSSETEMTKRQIQSLINRKINVYLSASEAIEKGLADEVL
jgi:ATP-dependent Clp protease, protease subunit